MAIRRVLDTNVALYLLSGRVADPLRPAEYYVSGLRVSSVSIKSE